eukprot:4319774-Amphidinium_carterae.1
MRRTLVLRKRLAWHIQPRLAASPKHELMGDGSSPGGCNVPRQEVKLQQFTGYPRQSGGRAKIL